MDEVLSYVLISDSSLSHVNDAMVSDMDANPPLFFNFYWLIGHTVSLNPLFLPTDPATSGARRWTIRF